MAQSVKRSTSAQVMVSWFVSQSPMSGAVLTAQSLEPALDSVSPLCPPWLTLCLYLSKMNKCLKIKKKKLAWSNWDTARWAHRACRLARDHQ